MSGIKVYWYNDLKKVPNNFSWYIAHEFFDVLPIHKFEVSGIASTLIKIVIYTNSYKNLSQEKKISFILLQQQTVTGLNKKIIQINNYFHCFRKQKMAGENYS